MNLNSIYNALGSVDDKYVSEAAAVKKKRPIALVIAVTAAALAAMSMIVGFRVSIKEHPSTIIYRVGNTDIEEHKIQLTAKKINVCEEFLPLFEDDTYWQTVESPQDYCDIIGIAPLINENFTLHEDEAGFQIFKPMNGMVGYYQVKYDYIFDDNNIGTNYRISMDEHHFSDPAHYGFHFLWQREEDDPFEILTLNDGSDCIITYFKRRNEFVDAQFAYEGSYYSVSINGMDDEPVNIETMKIVLKDLGVL